MQPLGEPLHRPFAVGAVSEGCQTEVALAAWAESHAWRTHYVGAVQQLVKELSAAGSIGCAQPDVRGIHTSVGLQACC